jgi:hypothetical protein
MGVRRSVMLKRRRSAVEKFMQELTALLSACEPQQSITRSMPTWAPKAGQRAFVAAQHGVVDQLTRPAAIALDSVGVGYQYKPAGTWQTQAANPVLAWSTLLTSPMIQAETIYSLCNQAIGHLIEQINDAVEHEDSLEGRIERAFGSPWRLIRAAFGHAGYAPRADAVGTFLSAVAVALVAAYLSHVFHWVR